MQATKAPTDSMRKLHSRREGAAYLVDFICWKAGLFKKYLRIDYSRVTRVVFVCKGNICRSAYAEAKFNKFQTGATSAGTNARTGAPANLDAIRVASELGVDLRKHRARSVSEIKACNGDLFVCMEKSHADAVKSHITHSSAQILLLGGLIGLPRLSDPYGKDDIYFKAVFSLIDCSVNLLCEELVKHPDWQRAHEKN